MSDDLSADATTVALDVIRALRAGGIPCAIGGAIALSVWGAPRGTKDADINAFVPESRYEELLDLLVSGGCLAHGGVAWTEEHRAEFIRRAREGEVAVAWKDGLRVDVFVPSIPFYAEAQATVHELQVGGQSVPVLSAEALCVFKLLFFRDKDLVDLRRLVARQGAALDVAYVRRHMVEMLGESDERIAAWDTIVREGGPR